jgi:hypothetical protein
LEIELKLRHVQQRGNEIVKPETHAAVSDHAETKRKGEEPNKYRSAEAQAREAEAIVAQQQQPHHMAKTASTTNVALLKPKRKPCTADHNGEWCGLYGDGNKSFKMM